MALSRLGSVQPLTEVGINPFTLAGSSSEIDTKIRKKIGAAQNDFMSKLELLARNNPKEYFKLKNAQRQEIENSAVDLATRIAQQFAQSGIPDDDAISSGISIAKLFRAELIKQWNKTFGIANRVLSKNLSGFVAQGQIEQGGLFQ